MVMSHSCRVYYVRMSSQTQSDINQGIILITIEQATKRFNPPTITVRAKQMTGDCSYRPLHSSDGCSFYDDDDRRSSSAEEDSIIVLETSAATITASTTNTQHRKHSCVTRSFLHVFSSFQPHALALGFLVKIVAIVARVVSLNLAAAGQDRHQQEEDQQERTVGFFLYSSIANCLSVVDMVAYFTLLFGYLWIELAGVRRERQQQHHCIKRSPWRRKSILYNGWSTVYGLEMGSFVTWIGMWIYAARIQYRTDIDMAAAVYGLAGNILLLLCLAIVPCNDWEDDLSSNINATNHDDDDDDDDADDSRATKCTKKDDDDEEDVINMADDLERALRCFLHNKTIIE
jgi:hypothetical protein